MNPDFWRGRRVLVTGHTGFKGSWLVLWLESLGAEVHGYALEPPTDPSLFALAGIGALPGHEIGDLRDADSIAAAVARCEPEIVFHLAAQSLVRESYAEPAATFATNVMGTVHLLEAVRACATTRVVVNVTTDKCYDNREWPWAYRENDALGGRDPYSGSKACAELVTAAWRASFLEPAGIAVATARAGNVIGGGDFANDRLLPDFFRAVDAGVPLGIRSPGSTRPWQHVLEPLSGYLRLAEALRERPADFAEAWNFGPADDDARSVRWIVDRLVAAVDGASFRVDEQPQPHEAGLLRVDSSKARARLGWAPRWTLASALDRTLEWHRAWRKGADMREFSLAQIAAFAAAAGAA